MDGTALVYCEGAFGTVAGKTAHGLVRFTDRYEVLGVVDSTVAGRDAGELLDGEPTGIPLFASVGEAVDSLDVPVAYLAIGLTPGGGRLSERHRADVRQALELGLNVDSGLHEYLADDPLLAGAAAAGGARIRDVRRPPPVEEQHFFCGKIDEVTCMRVAVLGTDSAIGKRTTSVLLARALEDAGVRTAMVGTGQTSWFQGVRHGFCLDALITDFVTGELEHAVHSAFVDESPDAIVIEGQGSLYHPAFASGLSVFAAARPHGVVIQHAPARTHYGHFPKYEIPDLARQIEAMELLGGGPVVAIAVNHEGIERRDLPAVLDELEARHGRPALDPLAGGMPRLVDTVLARFSELSRRSPAARARHNPAGPTRPRRS